MIIKLISLVRFGDLVIWWQNNYFSEWIQTWIFPLLYAEHETLNHEILSFRDVMTSWRRWF